MVLSGVWFSGALAEEGVPTLPPTLLLMKVGYCFIGLLYGTQKWFHISLHTG